jgi:hypothetical protein
MRFPRTMKLGLAGLAVALLLSVHVKISAQQGNPPAVVPSPASGQRVAYNIYPRVVELLAKRGADPKVWSKPNKAERTPLFIAEGFTGRLPRLDPPTIAAVTKPMLAAGLSTDGERPKVIDIYSKQAEAPKPSDPAK